MRKHVFISVIALTVGLFVLSPKSVHAQSETAIAGTWKTIGSTPLSIKISFERSTGDGRDISAISYQHGELGGLAKSQTDDGGPVEFQIVREAGTIEAKGDFANGVGSGTFRFVPEMSFVSAMKERGFDFETPQGRSTIEERLFRAANIGLTTTLAEKVRNAGSGKATVDDLFTAAILVADGKNNNDVDPRRKILEELYKASDYLHEADALVKMKPGIRERDE